jgi:hypothetical protein
MARRLFIAFAAVGTGTALAVLPAIAHAAG